MPDPLPLSARLRGALDEVPALVALLRGPRLVVEFVNRRHLDLTGDVDLTGRSLLDVVAPVGDAIDQSLRTLLGELRRALERGEGAQGWAVPLRFPATPVDTYWDYVVIPLRNAPGEPPVAVAVHATEVTRLVEERRRFTTLFEANVVGVTISDETRLFEANDAFLDMVRRSRDELAAGLDWTAITAPESLEADRRALELLRTTGAVPAYEKDYLRPDGSRVPVLISGSRLQQEPLLVLATAYDLSERQALLEREREARVAAERAVARAGRLQEITATLSASRSADQIARAVVHHAVEDLSASAGLLILGAADPALAHAVGVSADTVQQWRAFPATLPAPVREAARTGAPVRAGAIAAFPLPPDGPVSGALALAFREPRELGGEERELLTLLTTQAAAALDRAQLYENRAYVARKLQEGLLPERLAEVPGLETAIVYQSITGTGEVGGDFYDLFETGRGDWVALVGDVSGKGTEAAVVTGIARHTVRAVARMEAGPAAMLGFLNGALRRHAGAPAFCTIGLAVVRAAADGGFDLRLTSGGHPFPLVARAGGHVEEVPAGGTMLGACDDPSFDELSLHLAPGDALMVYTDGVIDARARGGERFGDGRLRAALRAAVGGSAAELARAVEAAVRAHHPGEAADDRAILVLRAAPVTPRDA